MQFNSVFCNISSTTDLLQVLFVVRTPFLELSQLANPSTQLMVAFEVEIFSNKQHK